MNYVRQLFSYLVGSNDDEAQCEVPLSLQETLEVLQSSEENPEPLIDEKVEIPDDKCYEASGKVTHIDSHYGIIDKNLYFETTNPEIEVGMTVHYLAYKIEGEVRISKILYSKNDDWVEESSNKEHDFRNTLYVSPVLQVIGRDGRTVKLSNNLEIDLNKVESDFIPIVGDYLSVKTLVEEDPTSDNLCGRVLNVFKIFPVTCKCVQGEIRFYNENSKSGKVNTDIYFHKDMCSPGYVPKIRDKVFVEIIESQFDDYNWRALKLVPIISGETQRYVMPISEEDSNLLKDKNGISLPTHLAANMQQIGEKQIISLQVNNKGETGQTLLNISFKETNLTLDSPLDLPIVIKPRQSRFFKIQCEATVMGTTNCLVNLSFDGFSIGRHVKVSVVPINVPQNKGYYKKNKNFADMAWKSFQNKSDEVITGRKPLRAPSFIHNKLKSYDIPPHFGNKVYALMSENKLRDTPVEEFAPVFKYPLNINNYSTYFHYLLYLEEICLQVNVKKYDMNSVFFVKDNEFLILQVGNLAERRPSLVVGDKLTAYSSFNRSTGYEGYIHKTDKDQIWIKFCSNFHNMYNGEDYDVEFCISRTSFRKLHQGVDLAVSYLGEKYLFPCSVTEKPPQIEFICEDDIVSKSPAEKSKYFLLASKSLNSKKNGVQQNKIESEIKKESEIPKQKSSNEHRNITPPKNVKIADKTSPPTQNNKTFNASTSNATLQTPKLILEWFDTKLNHYQKEAVKNILRGVARPLPYFIFGPPGTGKTVTLIETMLQLVRLVPHSRILVCTPSNAAADLIALRLLDANILEPGDMVRMVAYRCVVDGTIPERLLPFCVTGDLAREGSRDNRNVIQNGVQTNMQASQLGRHRVTIGTCAVVSNLYTMGFPRGHFTHIIIDEAGQATEPESMIPLSFVDVKTSQTVLAGDPRQLGPCVFSNCSKENGLADSYFERIFSNFPYSKDTIGFPDTSGYDPRLVTQLVYNYRSLPELLTCPNILFYNNELLPTISVEDSDEARLLRKVESILPAREGRPPPSLIFVGIRGQNYQTQDCPSWFNPMEAGQVFYIINELYKLGVQAEDIGVITPYLQQGHCIAKHLKDLEFPLPKIGSVEEFQGQEFKIVILSCVRSNEVDAHNDSRYGLGFIASPRRLNVAISRAQALLYIVGNPHLLIMDSYWRSVLKYAVEIGGYIGCDLPNMNQ